MASAPTSLLFVDSASGIACPSEPPSAEPSASALAVRDSELKRDLETLRAAVENKAKEEEELAASLFSGPLPRN